MDGLSIANAIVVSAGEAIYVVRYAAFGFEGWTDLGRVGALLFFGLAMWRLAIYAMTRKLID